MLLGLWCGVLGFGVLGFSSFRLHGVSGVRVFLGVGSFDEFVGFGFGFWILRRCSGLEFAFWV